MVVFPITGNLPGSLFVPGLLALVGSLLFSVGFSLLFGLARDGRAVETSHLLVVFGTVGLALLLAFFALMTLRSVEVQERLTLTPDGLVREQFGRFHSSVDAIPWSQCHSVEVLGPNDRALTQGEVGGTLFIRFAGQQLAVGQGTDIEKLLALQKLMEGHLLTDSITAPGA